MQVEVTDSRGLRFDDGTPVRAASALGRLGDGWLVVQDDATHAAWLRGGSVTQLRVFPPVEGLDVFSEADGTKHLKPDLEAACELPGGLLVLGSGSTPRRMRAALLRPDGAATVGDLTSVYEDVARTLGIPATSLNLEGACLVGGALRWFNRGNLSAGVESASVDVPLEALLGRLTGGDGRVEVSAPRSYDLGAFEGVGLAVTDAVSLAGGRVLVSCAAEDTPNAVDDGPVVATGLAVLDGDEVVAKAPIPEVDGVPHKVEGLSVLEAPDDGLSVLAVVDADDPGAPSLELHLRVRW